MAVPTGWAKPRMWAQYGLNHTGVCLVFSKEELERQLSRIADFNRFDFVRYGPAEVIGTLGMTINGNALSDQGVSVACLNHFKATLQSLLFVKNIDYRDESECRLFIHDPLSQYEYLDIAPSIKAVIIGDKTAEAYSDLIKQQCRQLGIESRKIMWSEVRPRLVEW